MTDHETIETAALRVDGEVWTLPRPARHHVLIYAWGMAHWRAGHGLTGSGGPGELPDDAEQGFVTSTGRFVTRDDALTIALAAGQVGQLIAPGTLSSEDLW
jgi:hypothetical protein